MHDPRSPLDSAILEVLAGQPLHGFGIQRQLADRADVVVDRAQGWLYPALYSLEARGLVRAQWGRCANDRRARYYSLTAAGRTCLRGTAGGSRRGCAGAAGALACGMAVSVAAGPAEEMPRVRSSSPLIASLVRDGVERSRTFRQLVDTIGRTDGIVYVEPGHCGHGVRACLLLSVTRAAGYRLLRVAVDTREMGRSIPIDDAIASLAHELGHAIEILRDPAVNSPHAMFFFYAREAATERSSFETPFATRAGNQVRRELH